MQLGLDGKCALVTGSYRGTGAAIAETLAHEGAVVFLHGPEGGPQNEAAVEYQRKGYRVHAVSGDIATDAGADQVCAQVGDHAQVLDVLINNLGQAAGGAWHALSMEDWVSSYQLNTLSAVRMIDRFVPAMRTRGWGRVIQLATIGVLRPGPKMPHYYASKAALASITASLAKDLAGTGVTANTVSPGLIRTRELEQYFEHLAAKHGWGPDWASIERRGVERLMPNPMQRMARVEEVASLVAYLCSELAGYINSANIRIDGGATELAL